MSAMLYKIEGIPGQCDYASHEGWGKFLAFSYGASTREGPADEENVRHDVANYQNVSLTIYCDPVLPLLLHKMTNPDNTKETEMLIHIGKEIETAAENPDDPPIKDVEVIQEYRFGKIKITGISAGGSGGQGPDNLTSRLKVSFEEFSCTQIKNGKATQFVHDMRSKTERVCFVTSHDQVK